MDGIIFIVDTYDRAKMEEARLVLHKLINEEEMR